MVPSSSAMLEMFEQTTQSPRLSRGFPATLKELRKKKQGRGGGKASPIAGQPA